MSHRTDLLRDFRLALRAGVSMDNLKRLVNRGIQSIHPDNQRDVAIELDQITKAWLLEVEMNRPKEEPGAGGIIQPVKGSPDESTPRTTE